MKLYTALITTAKIHSATTIYSISQVVRVDVGLRQAFDLYHSLGSQTPSVFFTSADDAVLNARERYLNSRASTQDAKVGPPSNFFSAETLDASNDAQLNRIYGDGVIMRTAPTVIIYEVEVNENEPALSRNYIRNDNSYLFQNVEDKKVLTLKAALTQSHCHDFCTMQSKDIFPHDEQTTQPQRPRCSIM